MRAAALLVGLALAAPLAGASVAVGAPGAPDARVQQVEALRQGEDPALERTEAQYRASYYYSLGLLAAMAGQHDPAVIALTRAQAVDPGSRILRRSLAEELEAAGQDDKAAVAYKACLADEPQDLDLRRHLSRLYLQLEHGGEARALFLQADGSDPLDPEWQRSLIGLDLLQEDLGSATARLRELVACGGDDDDRELLGLTLQRREQWGFAAEQFRAVVKDAPSRATVWARLAACDEALGDTPTAKADLQAGLQASPGNALLEEGYAKLSYRSGDFNAAEQGFGQLLAKDPHDVNSLLFRGLARLKAKRYAEAELDFTALGTLEKDDPSQTYALALARILQKKYPAAEEALKRVLSLNPQAEPAWIQLAFLYDREKRPDQARQALEQGLKALPRSEDLPLLLAASFEDAGRLKEAEGVLRKALGQGSGAATRFQLAVILDKEGQFPQAEAVLEDLIAIQPDHAQALNYLGYSWADRGVKLDQAEALIRRALAVDPGNRYYLDSLGWDLYKESHRTEALEALRQAAVGVAGSDDAEEAVVFDHLAVVQAALGHSAEAAEARSQAQAIRDRAKAKPPKADDDMDKEPAL